MKIHSKSWLVIWTLILALNSFEAFPQTAVEITPTPPCTIPIAEKDKLEIQKITLSDQELIKQIGIMLEEKQADSVFQRRGISAFLTSSQFTRMNGLSGLTILHRIIQVRTT